METLAVVALPEQPLAVPLPDVKLPLHPVTWLLAAGEAVSVVAPAPTVVAVEVGDTVLAPLPGAPAIVTLLIANEVWQV